MPRFGVQQNQPRVGAGRVVGELGDDGRFGGSGVVDDEQAAWG
ncbi:MAG: hypothetical protein ACLPXZ_13860 [Mycobacterium sp.]